MSDGFPYIGIDFGTTNSSMAWYNPRTRKAEIILNAEGEGKTPSLVYYGEGEEVLVGRDVRELLEDVSEDKAERAEVFQRTQMSIKRDLLTPPRIPLPGGHFIRPKNVAAEILKKLKHDAEKGHFRVEVSRAIITCPAEFNYLQRQTIKDAGLLAGFDEVELLEEPVAGALAYAMEGLDVGRHVLVYDLGGGTFDLAVLENEDGSFHVASVEPQGMERCGGDDFDRELYHHCDEIAREKLGRPLSVTGKPDMKMLELCRRRKENLSQSGRARFGFLLPSDDGTVPFAHDVDRETFEGLIDAYVDSTVHLTKEIVEKAGAKGVELDTVVLIGGSSRVPLVGRRLKETLPVEPLRWEKQDLAVALGAAYHAHKLWGEPEIPEPPLVEVPDLRGKTLADAERATGEDLELHVAREDHSEQPEGTVIRQDPAPDERADRGSKVSVVLSGGRQPIEVPRLVGLKKSEARKALADAGLGFGLAAESPSGDSPRGTIVRQDPAAGTAVAPGSSVSVVASLGERGGGTRGFVLARTLTAPSKSSVSSVDLDPEGRILVCGGGTGRLGLFDVESGEVLHNLAGHAPHHVRSVVMSPDGRYLASGGDDRTVRLWSASTGEALGVLPPGHARGVTALAVSRDGQILASGDGDGKIRLWEPETKRPIASFSGHPRAVTSIAMSPNGRVFASSGGDREIKLWSTDTGGLLFVLHNPGWWVLGKVFALAVSPDGHALASGDASGRVRFWDLRTTEILATSSGHSGPVRSVVMSPDGRYLASGGDDRTVRLWGRTGEELQTLGEYPSGVTALAVSPDGRILTCGTSGGTIKVWEDGRATDPFSAKPGVDDQTARAGRRNTDGEDLSRNRPGPTIPPDESARGRPRESPPGRPPNLPD